MEVSYIGVCYIWVLHQVLHLGVLHMWEKLSLDIRRSNPLVRGTDFTELKIVYGRCVCVNIGIIVSISYFHSVHCLRYIQGPSTNFSIFGAFAFHLVFGKKNEKYQCPKFWESREANDPLGFHALVNKNRIDITFILYVVVYASFTLAHFYHIFSASIRHISFACVNAPHIFCVARLH